MGRERTTGERRSVWKRRPVGHTAPAFVLALPLLSGCVTGMLVRSATWDDDPSPFWIVMQEDGDCTAVFDDVLIRGQKTHIFEKDVDGSVHANCGAARTTRQPLNSVNVLFYGRIEELDLSAPSGARRGPGREEADFTIDDGGRSLEWLTMSLIGPRFGASPFCLPRARAEQLQLIYNAGVDKDVHVLIGTGNRECSFG